MEDFGNIMLASILTIIFIVFLRLMIQKGAGIVKEKGGAEVEQLKGIDDAAARLSNHPTFRRIEQIILHVAYALFVIGITISLSTDQATRDSFFAYIVLMLLAVISYSLSKAYKQSQPYEFKTKKMINFAEDVIVGIIFVLMIIFITGFVNQNSSKLEIVISYWIYMVSMILFKILHIIKWYHYCIGSGKDNYRPWGQKDIDELITPEQKVKIQEMIGELATGKKQQIKLEDIIDVNNMEEEPPTSDRPLKNPPVHLKSRSKPKIIIPKSKNQVENQEEEEVPNAAKPSKKCQIHVFY